MLDPTHQLDTLFGVVNIPNVIWIDEDGVIVRPAGTWLAEPASGHAEGDDDGAAEVRPGTERSRSRRGRRRPVGRPAVRPGPCDVLRRDPRLGDQGSGERVRPQPRRGRRPVAATFGRDVGGRRPLRTGQSSVARRSTRRRRSPTSSNAIACSRTTGRTSVRPGRSSATSGWAATTAGGRRRRSRARKPTGRSSRTSAPTSRRSRSAATTRRPSDPSWNARNRSRVRVRFRRTSGSRRTRRRQGGRTTPSPVVR